MDGGQYADDRVGERAGDTGAGDCGSDMDCRSDLPSGNTDDGKAADDEGVGAVGQSIDVKEDAEPPSR